MLIVEVHGGAGGREEADVVADGRNVRSVPDEGVQLLQTAEDQVFQIADGANGQVGTQRREVVQEFQLVFFQKDELFHRGRFVGGKGEGLFIFARHALYFFVHDRLPFFIMICGAGTKSDESTSIFF